MFCDFISQLDLIANDEHFVNHNAISDVNVPEKEDLGLNWKYLNARHDWVMMLKTS